MSIDKTVEELSGTLAQLGILVEHINTQIIGITSRINMTLDNFDHSVAGIATDAGLMTGQVGDTISQVPNAWVFYLLFITLIIVLILLSVLIVINLMTRIHAIYRIIRGDTSRPASPVPSIVYSESKQPLNIGNYPTSPLNRERLRHIAVPMENEPRRYGLHESMSGAFNGSQDPGGTATHGTYYPTSRSTDLKRSTRPHRNLALKGKTVKANLLDQLSTSFVHYKPVNVNEPLLNVNAESPNEQMPPRIETEGVRRIVSMLENQNEAYLRRPLNPQSTQFDQRPTNGSLNAEPQRVPPPRYNKGGFTPYRNGALNGAEPV